MRYEGDVYRPPGEWRSYLLQATVGCSHNGCTFCSMYKDKRFRIRPLEELSALRRAGLYRLYLGVETGNDDLLRAVRKGVDAAGMLEAGRRLMDSGFDLWTMIILGLAGPGEGSRRHILDTAALINAMAPRHLSALTLMVQPGTPMGDAILRGEGRTLTPRETLEEIRLLLEHLEAEPLHFTSDHASNYLPLKGGLPEDRARLLALVNGALSGQVEVRPEFRRGL